MEDETEEQEEKEKNEATIADAKQSQEALNVSVGGRTSLEKQGSTETVFFVVFFVLFCVQWSWGWFGWSWWWLSS